MFYFCIDAGVVVVAVAVVVVEGAVNWLFAIPNIPVF